MKKKKSKKFQEKHRFKLIIFDFDGTIVDSVPGIHKNANEMAKSYGMKKISKKTVVKSVGAGLNNFLKWVFKPMLKKMTLAGLKKDYVKRYRRNYKYKAKLYPGVKATLAYLKKKKVKLAIISNKSSKFVDKTNKYVGIYKYFDCCYNRTSKFC